MPKKGEFSEELIRSYFARLYHQCGFRRLSKEETIKFVLQYQAKLAVTTSTKGKKKSIPKGKEGLQIVLRAETQLFFVYILTTVDWNTGLIKDVDEGWVFIVDKRRPQTVCFHLKPLRRTQNYFDKISSVAEAEFNRIHTMPSCAECHHTYTIKLVKLAEGKYGYKIDCPNTTFKHKHTTAKNFYAHMGDTHRRVLEKSFEEYAAYQQRNEENGTPRKSSRDIRAKKTKGSNQSGVHYEQVYSDGVHTD